MLKKIKQLVKSSKIIYKIYFYSCSFFLRVIGIFIKKDNNLALFVSYGGQRFDDSPKNIYDYLVSHTEYKNIKCVWAFIEPTEIVNGPLNTVKIDTLKYFVIALKAKYWISNSSASRGLNFMPSNTINVCTKHGMFGIKKLGNDLKNKNKSFKLAFKEKFDYILIEGKNEAEILKSAWGTEGHEILPVGLPRNDELVNHSMEYVKELKEKFGLPLDKKVILYAPTFREYNRDFTLSVFLKPPFDYDKWYQELGDEYVLLLTAHYEVAKLMNVPENHPFIVNAFKYPHINDLILASDILISDYSSIIFDYSIIEKPIISYAYDYDYYVRERGLYDGYEKIFSHGVMFTEDEVIEFIKEMNYDEECRYTKEHIKGKYILSCGNATKMAVEAIFNGEGK